MVLRKEFQRAHEGRRMIQKLISYLNQISKSLNFICPPYFRIGSIVHRNIKSPRI